MKGGEREGKGGKGGKGGLERRWGRSKKKKITKKSQVKGLEDEEMDETVRVKRKKMKGPIDGTTRLQ
jgi:hypothetical protein